MVRTLRLGSSEGTNIKVELLNETLSVKHLNH